MIISKRIEACNEQHENEPYHDERSVSKPYKKHQHNKHSRGAGQQKHKVTRTTRRALNRSGNARYQNTLLSVITGRSFVPFSRTLDLVGGGCSGGLFWDQDILVSPTLDRSAPRLASRSQRFPGSGAP